MAQGLEAVVADVGRNQIDAETTLEMTSHCADTALQAIAGIEAMARSSERIARAVCVVDEIAGQTDRLAKDAETEAARAGQGGRGLAIVARDAHGLAQRASNSAHEVRRLLAGSLYEVRAGVALVRQTGEEAAEAAAAARTVRDGLAAFAANIRNPALALEALVAPAHVVDAEIHKTGALIGHSAGVLRRLECETARHRMPKISTDEFGATPENSVGIGSPRLATQADTTAAPKRRRSSTDSGRRLSAMTIGRAVIGDRSLPVRRVRHAPPTKPVAIGSARPVRRAGRQRFSRRRTWPGHHAGWCR